MNATAVAPMSRHVHVEHCMGTVFSIDIRTPGTWDAAVAAVVARLHRVDAIFSTYRADSDISRMHRGDLRVADAAPEVADVLELCAEVQHETGGAFTALVDGRIDPTGLVKGWAVEEACTLLRAHGASDVVVNGGGDVQALGSASADRPWTIGIVDPRDRTRVLTSVSGRDFAVATSGTSERGAHIRDPFTGSSAESGLSSATVVGPSLTRADAYATAAFVLGREALRWIDGVAGYEALLVAEDGSVLATPGLRHYSG